MLGLLAWTLHDKHFHRHAVPPTPNFSWGFLVSQVMWWLELPIEFQAHTRLSSLAHGGAPAQHTLVIWSRQPGCMKGRDGATVHWVPCGGNIRYCVCLQSWRRHCCRGDCRWLSVTSPWHKSILLVLSRFAWFDGVKAQVASFLLVLF